MMSNIDTAPMYEAGESEKALILQLADTFRAVTLAAIPDPLDAMTFGSPAAVMFAGIIYGQMIGAGIESGSRQRTRTMLRTVEKQFKSGIEIGLRSASRIAKETGHQQ